MTVIKTTNNRDYNIVIIAILSCISLLLTSYPAIADIHIWTDKEGTLNITDYPPPEIPPEEVQGAKPSSPGESEERGITKSGQTGRHRGGVAKKSASDQSTSAKVETKTAGAAAPIGAGTATAGKPSATTVQTAGHPGTVVTPPLTAGVSNVPPQSAQPVQARPSVIKINRPVIMLPNIRLPRAGEFGMPELMMIAIILLLILYYLYSLYGIARREKLDRPWLSLVPIANSFTIASAAARPFWWGILMLLPGINIAVGLLLWTEIYKNMGVSRRDGLTAILYFSPFAFTVIALTLKTFAIYGAIYIALAAIYIVGIVICSSVFVLPGYFLAKTNQLDAKGDVSRIFQDGATEFGGARQAFKVSELQKAGGLAETVNLKAAAGQPTIDLSNVEANLDVDSAPEGVEDITMSIQGDTSDMGEVAERIDERDETVNLSTYEPMAEEAGEMPSEPIEGIKESDTFNLATIEPVMDEAVSEAQTINFMPTKPPVDMPPSEEAQIIGSDEELEAGTIDLSKIRSKTRKVSETEMLSGSFGGQTIDLTALRQSMKPEEAAQPTDTEGESIIEETPQPPQVMETIEENATFILPPRTERVTPKTERVTPKSTGHLEEEGITLTFDPDAEPEGIREAEAPAAEAHEEGITLTFDPDAEPEGVKEIAPPADEGSEEGITLTFDPDAEQNGVREIEPPTVEGSEEGITLTFDPDAEPEGVQEIAPPTAEGTEEGITLTFDPDIEAKTPPPSMDKGSKPDHGVDDSFLYSDMEPSTDESDLPQYEGSEKMSSTGGDEVVIEDLQFEPADDIVEIDGSDIIVEPEDDSKKKK